MKPWAAALLLALACWTAAADETGKLTGVRDAELVVQDATGTETRYPAGSEVRTRPRNRVFQLTPDAISPWAHEFSEWPPAEPARLVAAGTVAPDARTKPGQRFFATSLVEPPEHAVLLHRVFDAEVSMPAGPAFAGVVDKRGRVVAISHPFDVVAGKTLRPTMHDGGIYLELSRATEQQTDDELRAHFGATAHPPDFSISDSTEIRAAWLSLPHQHGSTQWPLLLHLWLRSWWMGKA
ncbi:MAG: hypothetical protein AAF354_12820, partial [Pseudomonadota bacterium]